MNAWMFTQAVLIAACFVLWPAVAKSQGMTPAWTSVLVCLGSLLGAVAVSGRELSVSRPSAWAASLYLAVSFANGWALYQYSAIMHQRGMPVGAVVTTVSITMIVEIALFDALFVTRAIPPPTRIAAYCTAILTIYLFSRSVSANV